MMHPPPAQLVPNPLAWALAKIHSAVPPVAFGLGMSVTGEHPVVALVRAGPVCTVPRAPALMGT